MNQSETKKREEKAKQDQGARRNETRPMNESKNNVQEEEVRVRPRSERKNLNIGKPKIIFKKTNCV